MKPVIHRLCDRPEWVPQCEAWDLAVWPRTPENAEFFSLHYADAVAVGRSGMPQVFIAEYAGSPIGMTSITANDHPDVMHYGPWLVAAYVVPAYRGRGVFSALHDAVVAYARDHLRLGTLYAHSHVPFEKWGWRSVEKTHDPFAPDKTVTIFRYDFL